ncbi:MAG: hypothetical protein GEU79_06035 [Acidimicrobiia bacterium]|nr:hypothetical protein [Acidimicrobiia bacterium]
MVVLTTRSEVALVIGAELSTVWSSHRGLQSHPSVVAVDRRRHIRSFGREAQAPRRGRHRVTNKIAPFAIGSLSDPDLARAYVDWLIRSVTPHRHRGLAVIVAPPIGSTVVDRARWEEIIRSVGVHPIVVNRLMAASLGLGNPSEPDRANMVVEVADGVVESIVVTDDGPVSSGRRALEENRRPEMLARMIANELRSVDPDHELDIRDQGIQLLGRSLPHSLIAGLESDLGVRVYPVQDPNGVVISGLRSALDMFRPSLVNGLSER